MRQSAAYLFDRLRPKRSRRCRPLLAHAVKVERLAPARPYRLRISIDVLPGMNTPSSRANRFVQDKITQEWRMLIVSIVGPHRPPEPLLRARARFVRHSSVQPDKAQLGVSFKPIEDALTRSRMNTSKKKPRWISRADVLFDDHPQYLDSDYVWERAPRGAGFITIEIDELETG